MYKNPLEYTKEDIGEIMNIPIVLEIGNYNSDIIEETIEGVIVNCTLAGNNPHLPASIKVETTSGRIRNFSLFEVKRLRTP